MNASPVLGSIKFSFIVDKEGYFSNLKYADDLKKAYALPIEVEEGQQIQLGGFIIENKATNVVVDESLDSNLEAQKDWFYKTSGLMIK